VNIGIIGWWRHDNQGDFRILENMTRALAPHRVVPIDLPFTFNEDTLRRLNLLDFLILGGGGLFQQVPPPPFDTFDEWGQRLETPIGVAGVGIDSIPDEYRRSVLALVEQARFFYVRDAASRQIVTHPGVKVAPDLSFLYPLSCPNGAEPPADHNTPVCGVNLRKCPELDAEQWIRALQGLSVHLRGIPLSGLGTWQEISMLRQLDKECVASFQSDLYAGLDMMIGTAFHAVVFAAQAAVPTIAIAYAPKVRRFMADIGLADYAVAPDEWRRLPELVAQLLSRRAQLADHLRRTTETLRQSAQQAFAEIRAAIEASAASSLRTGPRVSIVIAATGSDAANRSTLATCLSQTYRDMEVLLVGDDAQTRLMATDATADVRLVSGGPSEDLSARLNRAFAQATGEYLSWTVGGNLYAPDAITCMIDRLQGDPACDMVYTDYYTIHSDDLLADIYPVDFANKLFRRNVVGPSFLYRREFAQAVGGFRPDAPLPAYDYWLRAHPKCNMQPMHAPLFYALTHNLSSHDVETERQVRRQWRANMPRVLRAFWRTLDSDAAAKWVIHPLLAARHRMRALR
jgi:polysaccharide pyruvyl transferase WcaK-like protein